MTKLLYQGHGSFRITSNSNQIIYVDPYAGVGYDKDADLILVTHQHFDHNQIDMVPKKNDCTIITNFEALQDGVHQSFVEKVIKIQSVLAQNANHNPNECVGYIIEVDGIKVYAAGDTSKTEQMKEFADLRLDYALLPGDGHYNMNIQEATECANIIKAKHSIPIHLKPGELFDMNIALQFETENRIIIVPTQEIEL